MQFKKLLKKFGIYLASVLTAYFLAVVGASWHVADRLASMGVTLDAGDRLLAIGRPELLAERLRRLTA